MTCPFPFWGKKRPPIFQGQQKICEFQGVYILEPAFVFRPLDAESRCVWFRLVSRYSRYNISQQSPRRQSNSCPDILLIVFVVQRKNEHKKKTAKQIQKQHRLQFLSLPYPKSFQVSRICVSKFTSLNSSIPKLPGFDENSI